jgi:peptidoglycan/xylan/chitin deacetylase (PgdA/CDA1 family)
MAQVRFTFDNGPDTETTSFVLKTLERHSVLASFFVIGERMRDPLHRLAAEAAHAAGHWIGNHSMTHTTPLGDDTRPDAVDREIVAAQNVIGSLARPQKLFRPFGGGGHLDRRLLNHAARDYLVREGFTCVLWNVVPRDWEDSEGWTKRALKECAIQSEILLVLHDDLPAAMKNLDGFVRQLKDEGHTIVQDFPAACVPIRCGRIVLDVSPFVSGACDQS